MQSCSVNHVFWADCQCTVVHGGEGSESDSYAEYDSTDHEPMGITGPIKS